jgi:hypothetical protein
MKIKTFLRLKPLQQKHRLKEDYFSVENYKAHKKNEESKKDNKLNLIVIHDPLKRSKD